MKTFFPVAVFALLLGATTIQAQAPYPRVAPPPPPTEVVPAVPAAHPNWAWRPGYYRWHEGKYLWVPGAYTAPPHVGYRWYPGRWRQTQHGWVWVEGRWR